MIKSNLPLNRIFALSNVGRIKIKNRLIQYGKFLVLVSLNIAWKSIVR